MSIAASISRLLAEMGDGPVFTHSDPFRVARLVKPSRERDAYLDTHLNLLREATAGRDCWIPAFNYDFPKSGTFDVAQSPSQLGPLPERFRTTSAQWRTAIPIFSAAGIGDAPRIEWGDDTDPFGADSIFGVLVERNGVVLYYGDTFHYNTIVHFAERSGGGPMYRYDKLFPGSVVMADGAVVKGSLLYHVRPMGTELEYDWPGLLSAALAAGVCRRLEGHPEILAANAKKLSDLWIGELRRNPVALLDKKTKAWVEPALDDLGRRFLIGDFESPEPSAIVAS
ncbi:MAG TPA: AAC(3) family N-acetyltransferase [Gemmatimonadaceae bacterium]|nr:AAC(3) family N-acetyltransferase [Gemmatimonadaceae bacterium]